MKLPHANGMGAEGHDQSVLVLSQPVHASPQQSNNPEAIEISQRQRLNRLYGEQTGWLYATMIYSGPKEDRWLSYPFNSDEDDHEPINYPNNKNAYFGVALRKEKKDIISIEPTALLWLDMDCKERKSAPKGESLSQMPADDLRQVVAEQYHAFLGVSLALGLVPVDVLYSGHGLQVYFRASRLLTKEETEAGNRSLARRFAEFGADPKVYNAGRILRANDTYNVKNPERPIKTEVWYLNDTTLSDELVTELIQDGLTIRASVTQGKIAPEQKPKQTAQQEGGLIGWYNSLTLVDSYLATRGYSDKGDGRLSSPYSETGRDVSLLANKKGVQCAYLHSSSHPMAQWLGLDEESLSKHLIDPFEFLVYYEHGDGGTTPYPEARRAALFSLAAAQSAEAITQALEQEGEQVTLPDAVGIPNPLQPNKDKLDYSDEQAVSLLGLSARLATPDDDLAFAERLAVQAKGNLCYVSGRGLMAYDKEAYIWVDGDAAKQLGLKYAAMLPQVVTKEVSHLYKCVLACNQAGREQARAALDRLVQRMIIAKGKKGIGSRTAREKALADASTLLTVRAELFHARPFVLGFPNSVYDNGTVRGHRRKDYLTGLLPVEYTPDADQSEWLTVLDRITGSHEAFKSDLQYVAGYTLSGQSNQRLIFFLHGPKGTGKSTYAETLRAVLGKQAAIIDPKYLTVKADRERLGAVIYNKRLALCNEVGGIRLQAETLKTLGGSDGLTVRKLYQDAFDADPTHALIMISNDEPNLDTTDEALWERIQALPFTTPLGLKGQRDLLDGRNIQELMRDSQSAYLRGFLAWAMEGLERVRSGELFKASAVVTKASSALREESDPYREFWLEQGIEFLRDGIAASHLKGELEYWCNSNSVYFPKGRAMKAAYEAVGLVKKGSAQKWILEHPERFPV